MFSNRTTTSHGFGRIFPEIAELFPEIGILCIQGCNSMHCQEEIIGHARMDKGWINLCRVYYVGQDILDGFDCVQII
jgi:hypothetical protein